MLLLLLACGERESTEAPPVDPPLDSGPSQDSDPPDSDPPQDTGDPGEPSTGDWSCPLPELLAAEAGDSLLVQLGESVELSATGADSYSWTVSAGEAELEGADTATVRFTAGAEGLVELRLVATSGSDQAKDKVLVRVGGETPPPTARAEAPEPIELGEILTIDASASSGSAWSWSLVEAPSGSTLGNSDLDREASTLAFTPDAAGTWTLRLEVSDAVGDTDTRWVRAQVTAEARAPGYQRLEPLVLSATGLEGYSEGLEVKWSTGDGNPLEDSELDRFQACLAIAPERVGTYPFKVVFSDPDSGEVLERHYPEYIVVDGPIRHEPQLLDGREGTRISQAGAQLALTTQGSGDPVVVADLPLDGSWRSLFTPGGRTTVLEGATFDEGDLWVLNDGADWYFVEEGSTEAAAPLQDWGSSDLVVLLDDLDGSGGQELLVETTLWKGHLGGAEELASLSKDTDPASASVGDGDGDGQPDLWLQHTTEWDYSSGCNQTWDDLVWLQGPIEGSLDPADGELVAQSTSCSAAGGQDAGDLDGDGYGDLLFSTGGGSAWVYTGGSGGPDGRELRISDWAYHLQDTVFVADVDGDGQDDAVLRAEGVHQRGSLWVLHGPLSAEHDWLLDSEALLLEGTEELPLGDTRLGDLDLGGAPDFYGAREDHGLWSWVP